MASWYNSATQPKGKEPNENVRLKSKGIPGCFGSHLHLAFQIDNRYRLRQAVEGLLGSLLDPNDMGLIRAAKLPEAGGHVIKGLGKMTDLVPGGALDDQIQVSLSDFIGRLDQAFNRPQDPFSEKK